MPSLIPLERLEELDKEVKAVCTRARVDAHQTYLAFRREDEHAVNAQIARDYLNSIFYHPTNIFGI
jgi:hypothetical protein